MVVGFVAVRVIIILTSFIIERNTPLKHMSDVIILRMIIYISIYIYSI